MSGKWKQGALALLISLLLYLTLPMLSALLAVNEWADAEKLLTPLLLSSAVSAAVGTLFLVRRGKWSVFTAALLTGLGTQLLVMLGGYLIFGEVGVDGERWLLPVIAFVAALAAGLFLGKRGKKNTSGSKRKRR